MLNLSQKSTLTYSFILLVIITLLVGFLAFYFLYYQVKKVESVPDKVIKSSIIEINPEILNTDRNSNLNSNTMKGGEEE